jgi:hypothetical protein
VPAIEEEAGRLEGLKAGTLKTVQGARCEVWGGQGCEEEWSRSQMDKGRTWKYNVTVWRSLVGARTFVEGEKKRMG